MKLKLISGDFASEYTRTLNEYKEKQSALDEEYSRKIQKFVNMEVNRLKEIVPVEFEEGAKVKAYPNKIGTVMGSKIEFGVQRNGINEWDQDVTGPNRYWPLEDELDEHIITCEGFLRTYFVRFDSSELAKDWGINEDVLSMYADEIEAVE